MNAFVIIVGLVACAAAAGIAIFSYRGPLAKSQLIVLTLLGIGLIGAIAAHLALVSQDDMSASIRRHLDATTAHSADLSQRIAASAATMQVALAEPPNPGEPHSFERNQAWQKHVASLSIEAGALLKERDEIGQELKAIQLDVTANAANSKLRSRLSILSAAALFAYMSICWLALFRVAREHRIAANAAATRRQGLGPGCNHVERLAAADEKAAGNNAYREGT
jgi:hypothetical protein